VPCCAPQNPSPRFTPRQTLCVCCTPSERLCLPRPDFADACLCLSACAYALSPSPCVLRPSCVPVCASERSAHRGSIPASVHLCVLCLCVHFPKSAHRGSIPIRTLTHVCVYAHTLTEVRSLIGGTQSCEIRSPRFDSPNAGSCLQPDRFPEGGIPPQNFPSREADFRSSRSSPRPCQPSSAGQRSHDSPARTCPPADGTPLGGSPQ
jgi:hypothetical protein